MYTNSFTDVLFPAGTAIELPLDLVLPGQQRMGKSIVLCNYGREPEVYSLNTPDYIIVPTFDFGCTDDTPEKAIAGMIRKIKECALSVMLTAAKLNTAIAYGKNKDEIEQHAKKIWRAYPDARSNTIYKPYAFEYKKGHWLVSDSNDKLVIAIRIEPEVFPNPVDKTYYSWAEMGFACLDHRYVLEGRS